jgi:hypothetical protein
MFVLSLSPLSLHLPIFFVPLSLPVLSYTFKLYFDICISKYSPLVGLILVLLFAE